MELMGFFYDNSSDKLEAHGKPISKELLAKGYVQKDDSDGVPRWYVMPNKVWLIVDIDGINYKFNIYENIMALYPERSRISLKLARKVVSRIIEGDIKLTLKNNKIFLVEKN